MNRRELRETMKARRKELRGAMARLRTETKTRLEKNPAVRRERTRRRIQRLSAVAVLLLLASLLNCQCQEPVVPTEEPELEAPVAAEPKEKKSISAKPKKKPFQARIERQPRGAYEGREPTAPSWLDAFRLQVAARGPRLAECFTGTDRPGALRWTTAVNPKSGAVADHELEPRGSGAGLKTEQLDCLLKVLAEPSYKLKPKDPGALPERVGIVIEF